MSNKAKTENTKKSKNDVFEMKYFRKMSNLFFRTVFAFYKIFSRKVKNNRLKLKNKIEQLQKNCSIRKLIHSKR